VGLSMAMRGSRASASARLDALAVPENENVSTNAERRLNKARHIAWSSSHIAPEKIANRLWTSLSAI
jgi:hypothetical protein